MFVMLGLLVFPSQLDEAALEGTVLALALVLVARPLAVLAGTLGTGFTRPERILLGWAGLHGAVPVVLATFPCWPTCRTASSSSTSSSSPCWSRRSCRGRPSSRSPAGSASWNGRRRTPRNRAGRPRRARFEKGAEVLEYAVSEADAIVGRPIRDLGRAALVSLIVRGGEALPPRGSTRVEEGDRLHVLIRRDRSGELESLFAQWRDGSATSPR